MRGTHFLIVILTVLTLIIPAAAAEWAGRGFYEPDHARDATEGFMFTEPDTSDDVDNHQVYFNIYSSFFIAGGNPNSATTGSAIMPYPTSIHAFLGVWKDCNQDGYIGFPEGALLDYRAELLLDKSICDGDAGSAHNDGEWVQEFLWIGPDNATACTGTGSDPEADDQDKYNIVDNCARVWADFGQPEQAGTASCPVNPRPRGTYQSTGGFIRFVDCLTGWRGTDAVNDAAHGTGNDDLAFDDAEQERPDKSASPLNQKNPYGQQGDDPMVRTFDCNNPQAVSDPTEGELHGVVVTDPTGGDLSGPQDIGIGTLTIFNGTRHDFTFNLTDENDNFTSVGTPVVPSVNPSGSPAGTVNKTLQGVDECDDSENGLGTLSNIYDLDEGDFGATGAKRTSTDFYMNFQEDTARGESLFTGNGTLGEATPMYFGLGIYRAEGGLSNAPLWFGQPGYVASRNPYVNRDTFLPWGIVEVTGFAYVSPAAIGAAGLNMPFPTTKTYGEPHCNGTAPITGAWDCEAENWWEAQESIWFVSVGQEYNLRDIDCWDATAARGTPSATATAAGNACARPVAE